MARNKLISTIFISLTLYCLTTLLSFAAFAKIAAKNSQVINSPLVENNPNLSGSDQNTKPRTEKCPLNGELRTLDEKNNWQNRRPLGIMIENHQDARPQSGLQKADIVYEAVAEGGITRFLAIFYCQDTALVGPVRSARTYFVDYISEYGDFPLYAHVGGANTPGPANALGQIENYGWSLKNDLSQFSLGFPVFWRDYEIIGHPVATEHTMYSSTEKLWKEATKRKLSNVDTNNNPWDKDFEYWKIKDDEPLPKRPETFTAEFNFWEGYRDYDVRYLYDKPSNLYFRFNGNEKHFDRNSNEQLSVKNIVLLFTTEKHADDGYENNAHLLYKTIGSSGVAKILQDGKIIAASWTKKNRQARTKFTNSETGEEIKFNPGKIWIEILPTGVSVNFK